MEINYIEYHRYENRIELVIKYLERERERILKNKNMLIRYITNLELINKINKKNRFFIVRSNWNLKRQWKALVTLLLSANETEGF